MSIDEMVTKAAGLRVQAEGHRKDAEESIQFAEADELEADVLERKIGMRSVLGISETRRLFGGLA